MDKIERLKELTEQLNHYRDAYYNNSESLISDKQYDDLFDELQSLEDETGIVMSNSPTNTVGYDVKSELEIVKHSHPMLSLGKTKVTDDLAKFSDGRDCILSLKMDGLTVLNTYNNGVLCQSETRGNGDEGEIITHNAKVFDNLPLNISFGRKFEIEGEAIILQSDFEKINKPLIEKAEREAKEKKLEGDEYIKYIKDHTYANCRSLASGSARQLDSSIAKDRHVKFVAWKIPFGFTTYSYGFEIAARLGFEVVPYVKYNSKIDNIEEKIEELKVIAEERAYPIDGLVITYDNIEYGKSLGMTGHHPRHSFAFKFYDDVYEIELLDVEFTMGKTGVLTPTAIFKPVEIDGTVVERASLHNLSIMKELGISHKGQVVNVYKANQIIPQIASVEPDDTDITDDNMIIPIETCPICGADTKIIQENDSKVLICTNDNCKGKLLGKLSHFCSKNAINIEGMSEATLQFLIDKGWVESFKDIYKLDYYRQNWKEYDGFGDKSVDKLLDAIENSRKTTLDRFIYSLSIPQIGRSTSKDIAKYCHNSIDEFTFIIENTSLEFAAIDGVGVSATTSLDDWWNTNRDMFYELKEEFIFSSKKENGNVSVDLSGKIFVITGSLNHYKNRDELVSVIESMGGKVSGSVSAKSSFLINNDTESSSSKNKKAKQLGIPILSEQDFINMIS